MTKWDEKLLGPKLAAPVNLTVAPVAPYTGEEIAPITPEVPDAGLYDEHGVLSPEAQEALRLGSDAADEAIRALPRTKQ